MDTLNDYRRIIRDAITKHAEDRPSTGDVQIEMIFDEGHDHYELIYSGWDRSRRIHGHVLHLDLRGGKVWIQYDGTSDGIANELVEAGIPRDHIVLASKPPEVRQYTGFATN
jgi:hypothetical protein